MVSIGVKNVFLRFLNFCHVFTFFDVFFIFQTFLKNVFEVQSGKQINKKHFQNNSNNNNSTILKISLLA